MPRGCPQLQPGTPPAQLTGSTRPSKGSKSQRPGRSTPRVVSHAKVAEEAPLRGPMPLCGWQGELSVREIPVPNHAVRSRGVGGGLSPLTAGLVHRGPGPLLRSGGASSPEPVLDASGGRRRASPRGPAHRRKLCPRLSRGALSVRAGSPAAAAPLASPSCSPGLCCFLSLARTHARPRLAVPRFARGWRRRRG